ncbi:hypothetical protein BCV72DRAFT_121243 [Rhizopus microsporus var. microsporus]|uniref:Uncharacterized protein n=1 Tax=Rhizopus microsporus var. microsporus TaxID=86635 RepID=A0A1X0R3M7_RHIZD|nr:hypothetical protein BCV72DRAFT_121243 [Rhizopus microsporus var. microsporus]
MDSVIKHLNRSLGCTVLEMLTGTHPWMHLTSLAALYAVKMYMSQYMNNNILTWVLIRLVITSHPKYPLISHPRQRISLSGVSELTLKIDLQQSNC